MTDDMQSCCAPMRSEDLPKVNKFEISFNDKNVGKHEQVLIPAGKFTMGTEEDFFSRQMEKVPPEKFLYQTSILI